ncbi:ATP-binding protein [Aestuariibacter sp. AA17]|uniref:histidine kinase n=1 Tax=Fluctibacter corallii TaxID=2984329 RepID=A0ABT3A3S2_9ALTE|nr:hybrid sensor histidine kinase/response regulator transcription factor [Aestuariibacter sp. AA17]MCV2883316.1 ATP-binding protein [Aestuariibacter sp. AA17]
MPAHPHFSRVSVANGLSQNTINAVMQDKQGYLWIGTNDGLNRFNGYDIEQFHHQPKQPDSLASNTIHALYVDHDNMVWIGTQTGLSYYDFHTQQIHTLLETRQYNVVSLAQWTQQTVLVTTRMQGLYLLNLRDKTLVPFLSTQGNSPTQPLSDIRRVRKDAIGNIWLATSKGLFKLNEHTRSLNRVFYTVHDSLSNIINDIAYVGDDKLLIGTANGLYLLSRSGKIIKTYFHRNGDPYSLPSNTVNALQLDSTGRLWIGTSRGLSQLDLQTETFTTFTHSNSAPNSLSSDDVTTVFEDDNDNLWIGTSNEGVNTLSLNSLAFGLRYATPAMSHCLSNNQLYNVLVASTDTLWIAAYGAGLHAISMNSHNCKQFTHDPDDSSSISSHLIAPTSLYEDSQGYIWFGTVRDALNRLDPTTGKTQRFYPDPNGIQQTGAISTSATRAMVETQDGKFWLATDGAGLSFYDPDTALFTNYLHTPNDTNSVSSQYVLDLALDSEYLWIATETAGLDRLHLASLQFENFGTRSRGNKGTPNKIFSIKDDNNGVLWMGTKGEGLVKFNKATYAVTTFTTADGLPNNTVYAVEIDKRGDLWLATNRGLARFNPNTLEVERYAEEDGLQANEFNVGSDYSSHSDTLYFVGSHGFNAFSPKDIQPNTVKPDIVVEEFLLFNQPAPSLYHRQSNAITLQHAQNVIGFEFAAMDFNAPDKLQYHYMMHGFDDDWRTTTAKHRFATYTNLDAGEYQFKVKASNRHGVWSDEQTIHITVHPPLWLTWWAITLYAVVIITLGYGWYALRIRSLRARNVQLEQSVAQRTQEVVEQKFQVEQLLKDKTKEFDNISHEFRTPLAVILGRARDRLNKSQTDRDKVAFEAIESVAKRLAIMVDDVIEMGRAVGGVQAAEKSTICFSHLCKDICENLNEYAKLKKQTLSTQITSGMYLHCLPKAIEKMLTNLINNAIKYTPENGQIAVSLSQISPRQCQLTVTDNGPGIHPSHHAKIFERFYRVDDMAEQPGSGIGLSLVSDVVKAHNGTVDVKSEQGKGTCFTVTFPIACGFTPIHQPDTVSPQASDTAHPSLLGEDAQADQLSSQRPTRLPSMDNPASSTARDLPANSSSDKPTLLLVEDNAELQALLFEQLSPYYQVSTADNGLIGMKQAQLEVPAIIVSDINMPHMDGFQLLDSIKNHSATSHIPVILLTAKSDAASRIQGFHYQADGYIAKPYHLEELLAVIAASLNHQQRVRSHYQALPSAASSELSEQHESADIYSVKAIENCRNALEKRYQDPEFGVQDLVEAAHLSERQLARKFQAILGISPSEFINEHRLAKGKALLQQGHRVNQVADDVGFGSANYFARQYKKKYGITPSQEKKSDTR